MAGSMIAGQKEAESAESLRQKLEADGLRVEYIEEETETTPPLLSDLDFFSLRESPTEVMAKANEVHIVRIVHAMIQQAINDGASDIHIEPQGRNLIVRYRVDGVLHEVMQVPESLKPALISRIKLMADVNITERRMPQQGHIHVRMDQKHYDLRVATMPTYWGESVVMRIIDHSMTTDWTLDTIGFSDVKAVTSLLSRPQGLLLFAGPAGSGKTTVLYTALNALDAEKLNIVTVGDELAFHVEGVNHSKTALPIENAVRALVERDPDVIAIGELRKREEVEAALDAALTGHLILAVFHANDTVDAIERLTAMGVSPFQLSAGLAGVVASRLARRICQECKTTYQPTEERLRALGITAEQASTTTFHHGAGCDNCRQTGYRKRIGLFEVLDVDAATARLIADGATGEQLRSHLAQSDFRSLRDDGRQKALDGATTVEEVLRVTSA